MAATSRAHCLTPGSTAARILAHCLAVLFHKATIETSGVHKDPAGSEMAQPLPDRKALLYGQGWAALSYISLSYRTRVWRSQTAKAGRWYLSALPAPLTFLVFATPKSDEQRSHLSDSGTRLTTLRTELLRLPAVVQIRMPHTTEPFTKRKCFHLLHSVFQCRSVPNHFIYGLYAASM